MKNFLLGFILLGLTNLTFSQNEIAFVDANSLDKVNTVTVKETSKLEKALSINIASKRILSFQNFVSKYNLKTESIYTNDEPSTYTVIFRESNNTIKNIYNNEGEVIRSMQEFSAIRLPYLISSKVVKENPGWSIGDVHCKINYEQNKILEIQYKIEIKNNTNYRTIKVNKEYSF